MVEVYKYIPEFASNKLILSNDGYFNAHIAPMDLDKTDAEVIKEIDEAIILDSRTGTIQTPFGICSIDDISTGCKTVLNYNHTCKNNIDLYIDASECGANALECLFKQVEIFRTPIILRHSDNVFKCSDREYKVHLGPEEILESSNAFVLAC